jgi:hypothetical protein
MARSTRIVITLISCLALSILGVQGVASAYTSHQVAVGAALMTPQGHDWCC